MMEPVAQHASSSSAELASTQVLATYELLEQILLHLPLRTLSLSQRVCKSFQDVITGSKNIRKALFLEPCTEETILPMQMTFCGGDSSEWDMEYEWGTYYEFDIYIQPDADRTEWRFQVTTEPVSPFLNPFFASFELRKRQGKHSHANSFLIDKAGRESRSTDPANTTRTEHSICSASNTFLMQPPVRQLQIDYNTNDALCEWEAWSGVRFHKALERLKGYLSSYGEYGGACDTHAPVEVRPAGPHASQ